jgi:hypothetical protein
MANNQVITHNVNNNENNGGKHLSSTSPTMQSPFQNVDKTKGIIYSKNMAQNVTVSEILHLLYLYDIEHSLRFVYTNLSSPIFESCHTA